MLAIVDGINSERAGRGGAGARVLVDIGGVPVVLVEKKGLIPALHQLLFETSG
jgi:hypothetical protein